MISLSIQHVSIAKVAPVVWSHFSHKHYHTNLVWSVSTITDRRE